MIGYIDYRRPTGSMTVAKACEAMLSGRRFWDSVLSCEVWITAVEIGGSVEISRGDPARPHAVWVHLGEARLGELE